MKLNALCLFTGPTRTSYAFVVVLAVRSLTHVQNMLLESVVTGHAIKPTGAGEDRRLCRDTMTLNYYFSRLLT